ncbi:hypothetical protein B0H13DRAFT_2307015 [Mycena leptocephala]|nr:hypothetical protein B0H13DRAFT_2307015 [Mycena leptocephala]
MSSGYLSVPATAAQRVPPVPEKKRTQKTSSRASASDAALPPTKARGKREIARDAEIPRWMESVPSTGSQLQRIRGDASIVKVKPEPAEPIIRRKQIKQEHQSSPDLIIISDDDDDPVQIVNTSSIQIVIRDDGKVTLKQQHPRVEKTAQLAVDFYLGYYLFKLSFPGTEEKNAFARDALFNAAYTLGLADIMEKIRTETAYCDLLAPILHGRVSTFRLKAKGASDATVTANYSLHGNTKGRVAFLITGMRYIYPLSPGPVDPPRENADDVVDTTLPYMTAGIRSTLLHAFFKGSPSVASKYSQLFEINKQTGRKEVPAAMVALGGTAVHSSLNEYRTGRHVQSKFEGNSVQEIYNTHILLLSTSQTKQSTVFADLYDALAAETRLGSVAAKPMAMEALALLNL